MSFWRGRHTLIIGVLLSLLFNVEAQTTAGGDSANPGCYSRCGFIFLDYDPTKMLELCDKSTSLGGLFVDNISACADCISKNNALSSYYDQKDAQDTLDIVNLCQSNFPTSHDEMVSAMSVISEQASLVGEIATVPASLSATGTVPTDVPATQTSLTEGVAGGTAQPFTTGRSGETRVQIGTIATLGPGFQPVDETLIVNSREGSKAWIAGAVVGPIAGVALIVAAIFYVRGRRRLERAKAELPLDVKEDVPSATYEKPELPTQGSERHELEGQNAVEIPANTPPQELGSNAVAELPADERR
ncbi:hypothetical protein FQN54_008844 [Arachnomyces sp. PD_36]|nr:hypothetical protein FQN54_008844 [Arachnomyces sp. PD_36]